jgi:hypothetical protein
MGQVPKGRHIALLAGTALYNSRRIATASSHAYSLAPTNCCTYGHLLVVDANFGKLNRRSRLGQTARSLTVGWVPHPWHHSPSCRHLSETGEKAMDTRLMVLLVIAFVAIILIVTLLVLRKRRSDRLKQHFGPEYDRTVKEQGALRAETVLAEREQRVKKFAIHSLTRDDRERYLQEWTQVQKQFVDDPALAVSDADKLVTEVMASRGYPMGDFEQRAADVSVNYPGVVQNYRSARSIVVRRSSGQASTEDLRQAMVYFRSLFDELLDLPKTEKIGVSHERAS